MKVQGWLASKKHQDLFERWWIPILILWEIVKAVTIRETLGKYGINVWIYFILGMVIVLPYGHSTAKLLFAIIDRQWRKSVIYGVVAVALHFTPDIYIVANAKAVPAHIFDAFILVMAIFTAFGIRALILTLRSHRQNR